MAEDTSKVLFTVTVQEEITAKQIEYLLVSAFEGGSNYWITGSVRPVDNDYKGAEMASGVPSAGGALLIKHHDGECVITETLTLDKIKEGTPKLLKFYGKTWTSFYEDHDGGAADAWLQFCLFGELVYA